MAQLDPKTASLPEADALPAFGLAANGRTQLLVVYKNWRGEVAERKIIPRRIWFGSNQWHPEPQWLLDAEDVAKGDVRSFSTRDFIKVVWVDD